MKINVFATTLFFLLSSYTAQSQMRPTNLWMGTGGYFHTSAMLFPGATTPFGLVRLSPDTKAPFPYSLDIFDKMGYFTAGAFRVLPLMHLPKNMKHSPAVKYDHNNEAAHPGYYSLQLDSENVRVELTSSTHCGFHRYTKLSKKGLLHILFDVTSGLIKYPGSLDGELEINLSEKVISGQGRTRGDFSRNQNGQLTYFYAEYSSPLKSFSIWKDYQWVKSASLQSSGDNLGIALSPTDDSDNLELKVCVSHVSAKNAKLNFEAEARGIDFTKARALGESTWSEYFNRLNIETSDRELETLFYTTLYFSSIGPTHFADVNGEYLGFNQKTEVAKDFIYRTDLSLWDTFRTAHPLFNLIAPDIACDTVQSLMKMSKVIGVFPRLAYNAQSLEMMFGSPANFVLTEAFLKNKCSFDTKRALEVMLKGATDDEFTREKECVSYGYCPSDKVSRSVSKTLENAWADFAAANLAQVTNEKELENIFRVKEGAFRVLWDPKTRYFRPKDSTGKFTAFNPKVTSYFSFLYKPADQYAEGGPNHYRYSAPHHIQELISSFGGAPAFVKELESFMKGATSKRSAINPGSKYWHGNEHNIHAIYLFNDAQRPDLTQYWARWALRKRYALKPNGYDGNDDVGSLSAWFVLSAIGIYPKSGTDQYWLGSPSIDRATIELGDGHTLRIIAKNQSTNNFYVKSVRLNGHRLCSSTVNHRDLYDAELEFEMSAEPEATFNCQ